MNAISTIDIINLFFIVLLIMGFVMVIISVAGINKTTPKASSGTMIKDIDETIEKMEDTILKADLTMEDINQKSEKVLESFDKKQQQLLNLYDTMELANNNNEDNNSSKIDIKVDDETNNNLNEFQSYQEVANQEVNLNNSNLNEFQSYQEVANQEVNLNNNNNNNLNEFQSYQEATNQEANLNNSDSLIKQNIQQSNLEFITNSINNNNNNIDNVILKQQSYMNIVTNPMQYNSLADIDIESSSDSEFKEEILNIFYSEEDLSQNTEEAQDLNTNQQDTSIEDNSSSQQNKALQNTEDQFIQIKDLLEKGLTIPQIAKQLNIGQGQIEFIIGLRKDYL